MIQPLFYRHERRYRRSRRRRRWRGDLQQRHRRRRHRPPTFPASCSSAAAATAVAVGDARRRVAAVLLLRLLFRLLVRVLAPQRRVQPVPGQQVRMGAQLGHDARVQHLHGKKSENILLFFVILRKSGQIISE